MTTNAPTPTLKYLLCADYGDFTIPSIMNDSFYNSLGAETKADIHIRPSGPVELQDGSIMKGFKWRNTISVDMWAFSLWNKKTNLTSAKPGWAVSRAIKVSSDHDLGTNLGINGILGVPYGWGTINDKYCFMDDGVLNWTKTKDEYKSNGKRTNFGVDTTTTMDGDAWQMKTPVKSGRTLRSGRVLEQFVGDTLDFAMSQSKISIDYANSVKAMIIAAAHHAQKIIDKAGASHRHLTNLPHSRCITTVNKEIYNHLRKERYSAPVKTVVETTVAPVKTVVETTVAPVYSPPKRELCDIQESKVDDQALISVLEDKVKDQDEEITRLQESNQLKAEYIRLLKGNADMLQKVISGQCELIQLYTVKNS